MPGSVNLNPASILYDENGNPVGVILDGSIYRLQTEAKAHVHDGSGNAITSKVDGSYRRLSVEAKFPPGQSVIIGNAITPNLSNVVRTYVTNGSSNTMKVDGSVTPVVFTFDASETYDIELYEIRFLFGAQDILFDGDKFASKAALTNGLLVEVIHANGISSEIANIKINEDLLFFPTPANYILNNTGPKDILVMGISLGGAPILKAGTDDKVKITVRDDLDETEIATLKAQVYGIKV
jgi:hypothetical protein